MGFGVKKGGAVGEKARPSLRANSGSQFPLEAPSGNYVPV